MPPSGVGGRPRNAWNLARERRLVRLYTLTKLNKEEIRKVLAADDFNPRYGFCIDRLPTHHPADLASSRDIQRKLSSLFPPDYGENYLKFRPLNGENMTLRFDQLRRCKKGRVSKDRWSRSLAMSAVRSRSDLFRRTLDPRVDSCERYAHAFRNYADSALKGTPIILSADLRDSQPVCSPLLLLDGSSIALARGTSTSLDAKDSHEIALHERRLSESQLSALESSVSRHKGISEIKSARLREFGKRLATKYSDSCLKHVHSVVRYSSSNSWRSSLTSFSSGASSFISKSTGHGQSKADSASLAPEISLASNRLIGQEAVAMNGGKAQSESKNLGIFSPGPSSPFGQRDLKSTRKPKLTIDEQEVWRDLVDERALEPLVPRRPQYLSISLLHRKCCKSLPCRRRHTDIICTLCGFLPEHRDAIKYGWMSYYHEPYDLNSLDFYGNTPLHCAAASVSEHELPKTSFMIDQGCDIHICNTFGETFLHVLCHKGLVSSAAKEGFLELLRKLSRMKFRFRMRDHHGRTVLHNLLQNACFRFKYDHFLSEVFKIMEPDPSMRDNAGVSLFTFLTEMVDNMHDQFYDQELKDLIILMHSTAVSLHCYPNEISTGISNDALASAWLINLCDYPGCATWISSEGDGTLSSIIKSWKPDDGELGELSLERVVRRMLTCGASLHLRDREGNAPLALAACRGFRTVGNLLLRRGANIHSRDYYGTGILKQVGESLALAAGNPKLWARILACHNALSDAGAKINPTEQEEWMLISTERSKSDSALRVGFLDEE
jgi:hypothetical protein